MDDQLIVKVNGTEIQEWQHVSVTQPLNDHWRCHLEIRHTEDQRGQPTDAGPDSPVLVEEWLGADFQISDNIDGSNILFDGFVLEVELVYEHAGGYSAFLQGISRSFKMDLTHRHAYYQEKNLADIASQLAGKAQLQAKVDCKDGRPLNYVQWGESDFDFLRRLADDHGCWIRPTAQGIEILDKFQESQTLTLSWRQESENALRGFSVKGALAPPAFGGAHYDFHQMRSKVYTSVSDEPQFYDSSAKFVSAAKTGSSNKLPPAYMYQHYRSVTLDDYVGFLKKESVRSMGSTVTASGESINSQMRPGNTVVIDGIDGADTKGTYGVTHVLHQWDITGYTNQFTCTPWKNYTDPNPPAMKPWFGIVPARVMENNDPQKMGRIKIQHFWQEDGPTYWARMMTPHAGADRGFMFMPEVGDEVVVAFEDGDPERPVGVGLPV